MVHVPTEWAVTTPCSTVAISELLVLHSGLALVLRSFNLKYPFPSSTGNCFSLSNLILETSIFNDDKSSVISEKSAFTSFTLLAFFILTLHFNFIPLTFAYTLHLPTFFPFTLPFPDTVAIFLFELNHFIFFFVPLTFNFIE